MLLMAAIMLAVVLKPTRGPNFTPIMAMAWVASSVVFSPHGVK
jgi:hypothetical protein